MKELLSITLKLAAIDIGSNAIRFLVYRVISHQGEQRFKRIEYIRFPLRLGHDVFTEGKIKKKNRERFHRLMNAFKLLIDLYEVDDHYACATSAMRESENGRTIIKEVEQLFDLKIHLISGEEEAELINSVIIDQLPLGQFIHVDVGGGSTELNIIVDKEVKFSNSYKLGSVRGLELKNSGQKLKEMFNWIQEHLVPGKPVIAVGTGGNIAKLYELSAQKKERMLHLKELYRIQKKIDEMSLEERIFELDLNPDRADVIIPAAKLYVHAMESANASKILVPDVGLKDGIIHMLYRKQKNQGKISL